MPCFTSFDPNFKYGRYLTSHFSPKQTCLQNSESDGDEVFFAIKSFLEKLTVI